MVFSSRRASRKATVSWTLSRTNDLLTTLPRREPLPLGDGHGRHPHRLSGRSSSTRHTSPRNVTRPPRRLATLDRRRRPLSRTLCWGGRRDDLAERLPGRLRRLGPHDLGKISALSQHMEAALLASNEAVSALRHCVVQDLRKTTTDQSSTSIENIRQDSRCRACPCPHTGRTSSPRNELPCP